MIVLRLEQAGYATATAESGAEALAIVASDPVDLIFLDLIMEGMSGLEVLGTLKSKNQYQDIPVVIVSGVEDAGAVDQCLAAGAADFLHKPVKAETLREVATDWLGAPANNDTAPDTAAGPDLAELSVFDPSFIAQLSSDYGDKTAAEFISRFESLAPGQRDKIAASSSDLNVCRRAASGLKGGARSLGLTRLAGACRDIERGCAEDNAQATTTAISALDEHLNQALQALRDHAPAG